MNCQNKKTVIRLFLAFALVAQAAPPPVLAEYKPLETATPGTVPTGMNYQGRLEKDGFPVTGSKTMEFQLFDAVTGGNSLWTSGSLTVTVTQGIFSALLPIPTTALNGTSQRYLEVAVDGVTLSPRDPMRTVPYAAIAETVEGNIDISTAGLNFSVNAIAALVISSITNNVGVGTGTPSAQFEVVPQVDDTLVVSISSQDATAIMVVDTGGSWGLGTNSPSTLMHARTPSNGELRISADSDGNDANETAGVALYFDDTSAGGHITYTAGTDILGLGNGLPAVRHLVIDGAGEVGLGTDTPDSKLHVQMADATLTCGFGICLENTTNATMGVNTTDNAEARLSLGDATTANAVDIKWDRNATNELEIGTLVAGADVSIQSGNGAEAIHIDSSQLVGIGAAIPTTKLDVRNGNLSLTDDDVTHAVTGQANNKAFLEIEPLSGTNGGARFQGFTDADATAVQVDCYLGINDPTDSLPACIYNSGVSNGGTGVTGLAVLETAHQFQNNGTAIMTMLGSGNVGVGTVSPQTQFHVAGAARFGSVGIGSITPATTFEVEGSASFGTVANKSTFTATGSLLIDDGANIGVGTASPGARMHIYANTAQGAEATPAVQASGFLRVQNTGAAGDDAIVEVITGASGTGQVCFGDTAAACRGVLQYVHGSDRLDLGTSGTATRVSISATGALGVGSTAPQTTLHVNGNAQFGSGVAKSTFSTTGALTMANNVNVTVSGTGVFSGPISGNSTTATALAANGANCGAGLFAAGVDASGAAEGCTNVGTQAELNTHEALSGTAAHSATVTNTASQIVTRDGSGNFAAGTITANLTGNASGNAGTASALAADPTDCTAGQYSTGINAAGTAQGCADVATQTELNTHGNLTGTSAHSAASINTASALVSRDGSGNFAAGAITMTGINVTGEDGLACSDVGIANASTGDATCTATTTACMAAADYAANDIISCGTVTADALHTARCCRVQ